MNRFSFMLEAYVPVSLSYRRGRPKGVGEQREVSDLATRPRNTPSLRTVSSVTSITI